MKKVLIVLAVLFLGIILLGYLFVRWANKPENVAALKEYRVEEAKRKEEEAASKIEEAKKEAILLEEIAARNATLGLAIHEDFADARLHQLVFKDQKISYFEFKKNELLFTGMVYKNQSAQDYFILSRDEFEDFAAEIEMGIWGTEAIAGICWDVRENGERNPVKYQAAFSSPNTLYVEAGEKEHHGLGGWIASENTQVLRVEKFGSSLRVSVNGRLLDERKSQPIGKGKVGILLGHRGGIRGQAESVSTTIKSFKVWR